MLSALQRQEGQKLQETVQTALAPGFFGGNRLRRIGQKTKGDAFSGGLLKQSGAGADCVFQHVHVDGSGIGVFTRLRVEQDRTALRRG